MSRTTQRMTGRLRHGGAARTAAVGVLGLVIAAIRLPPTSWDVLWAEDAAVFSQRALDADSLPWGVFTPYAGYVHAIPQAVAWAAWRMLPPDAVAAGLTAASLLLTAAVCALVYAVVRRRHVAEPAAVLLALVPVLVPGVQVEVLGNLANLHWFALWAAPFVFSATPRSPAGAAGWALVGFLVVTTEIQSLLFLPLLLWRFRRRYRWAVAGAVLLGAAVQVCTFALNASQRPFSRPPLSAVADGYALQVALTALTGSGPRSSAVVGALGWWPAYAALLPLAAVAVAALVRRRRAAAPIVVVLGASAIVWAAGFGLNFFPAYYFSRLDAERLADGVPLLRYAIVPLMFAFAAVILWAGRVVGGRPARVPRLHVSRASAVVLGLVVVAAVIGMTAQTGTATPFPGSQTPRADGPSWTDGVAHAREACRASPGSTAVSVQAAPGDYWQITMPCALVR